MPYVTVISIKREWWVGKIYAYINVSNGEKIQLAIIDIGHSHLQIQSSEAIVNQ